ncbi:MAG: DUF4416 family protein [Candidatus Aminicenantes bacterium]|nr:DUF4416 family protein [Candidatus Aminicenantes bacterium]
MADAKPFAPVKYVCGIIYADQAARDEAASRLTGLLGPVDLRSETFAFDMTEYYEKEMGRGLKRVFLSFAELGPPDRLAGIKLRTNGWEREIGSGTGEGRRAVNLDPGYLTASALFMATAKDFAHRVALRDGIYAHLELLFTRQGARALDWTYPDFRREAQTTFFLEARRIYLEAIRG